MTEFDHYRERLAQGLEPCPTSAAIVAFLEQAAPARVCRSAPAVVLDWSAGAPPQGLPAEPVVGIGRYLEDRDVYRGDAFATDDPRERRSVHLGIDLFHPAGEPVYAPFEGVVAAVEDRAARYDYGPVVLIGHETDQGVPFFTLSGHLSRASVAPLAPGVRVAAGDLVGRTGSEDENGGWLPHLHFQLLATHLGQGTAVHGVAAPSEVPIWRSISPDPNLILRIDELEPASTSQHRPSRSTSHRARAPRDRRA